MQKIAEDIYKNPIPLPGNPLKELNSYIICSKGDTLVVDTGFNLPECEAVFLNGLKELDLSLGDVDLFCTHMHSDHCGLSGRLNGKVKSIYMGRKDAALFDELILADRENAQKWFASLAIKLDLLKYGVQLSDNPGYSLADKHKINFSPLDEGDVVTVGEYNFEVIDTPGHTPGHICLYDKAHKVMVLGDHVLARITPNIAFWGFEYGDILGTYMQSLNKIRNYDVKYMLTSHRYMPESLDGRVDELLYHHKMRLDEILYVLKEGAQTVSSVASKMAWSIRAKDWDDFPKPQKWFATLETMSHLEHLAAKGLIRRMEPDSIYIYEIK